MSLELKFGKELKEKKKINQTVKECNYTSTYFIKMLADYGARDTAKRLIAKDIQTGKQWVMFTF